MYAHNTLALFFNVPELKRRQCARKKSKRSRRPEKLLLAAALKVLQKRIGGLQVILASSGVAIAPSLSSTHQFHLPGGACHAAVKNSDLTHIAGIRKAAVGDSSSLPLHIKQFFCELDPRSAAAAVTSRKFEGCSKPSSSERRLTHCL